MIWWNPQVLRNNFPIVVGHPSCPYPAAVNESPRAKMVTLLPLTSRRNSWGLWSVVGACPLEPTREAHHHLQHLQPNELESVYPTSLQFLASYLSWRSFHVMLYVLSYLVMYILYIFFLIHFSGTLGSSYFFCFLSIKFPKRLESRQCHLGHMAYLHSLCQYEGRDSNGGQKV